MCSVHNSVLSFILFIIICSVCINFVGIQYCDFLCCICIGSAKIVNVPRVRIKIIHFIIIIIIINNNNNNYHYCYSHMHSTNRPQINQF